MTIQTDYSHNERDENYEWSLDETGRVYVSGYSYTQSGSMSANGHRGGSGTHNYESSSYTQGDGWSSFYHSGSFGSGYFYDDYDFTADWSESFNGVTNSYSSAHSASNDVEGYEYNLSGYFSDYYNTWTGQSPDSGSYSDSYPSSNSYASTVTENGFSFTWNGWDVQTRQGVYIHNTPYSGIWDIPFGLGSWSNPVEQPNSAWSSEPETPEPYSSPSQRYVDDLDDFFYGYDNSDLYETGLQEYGEVTITNASGSASYSNHETFTYAYKSGDVGNEGTGSNLTDTQQVSVLASVSDIKGQNWIFSQSLNDFVCQSKNLSTKAGYFQLKMYHAKNETQLRTEIRFYPSDGTDPATLRFVQIVKDKDTKKSPWYNQWIVDGAGSTTGTPILLNGSPFWTQNMHNADRWLTEGPDGETIIYGCTTSYGYNHAYAFIRDAWGFTFGNPSVNYDFYTAVYIVPEKEDYPTEGTFIGFIKWEANIFYDPLWKGGGRNYRLNISGVGGNVSNIENLFKETIKKARDFSEQ